MLEKYKGKEVRILVSSNSGAGTSTTTSAGGNFVAMSSVITIYGILRDFDSKFLEIKDSKLSYINNFNYGYSSFSGNKVIEPTILENDTTLVNIDSVISISII